MAIQYTIVGGHICTSERSASQHPTAPSRDLSDLRILIGFEVRWRPNTVMRGGLRSSTKPTNRGNMEREPNGLCVTGHGAWACCRWCGIHALRNVSFPVPDGFSRVGTMCLVLYVSHAVSRSASHTHLMICFYDSVESLRHHGPTPHMLWGVTTTLQILYNLISRTHHDRLLDC